MLTPRERDVLALMAEGRSNGAIAERFCVSERAVEKKSTSATSSENSAFPRQIPTTAACWRFWPSSTTVNRRVLAVPAFLNDR